uniref:Peptidase U62 modulator of DNA gyrase n=1 Tax=Cyanothece sp. (strain PCC 7425 / ATCC 29141) TaxID=395961 RepID=B8HKT8_CYAP4
MSVTLATTTADLAQKLGIKKFDLYGSTVEDTSVQVDHGKPRQVKASNRSSVTVRVWNTNGTVGVTSTTDTDERGLELALQTAQEASALGVKEHVPDFSPEATLPISAETDHSFPLATVPQLLEQLISAEQELLAAHAAIKDVPYNGLSQRQVERFYLNSEGADRREGGTYTSIYLYSKTEETGKKPRSAGAYRVSHSLDQLDIQGCLQEAAEKTISHLNYDKVASGKYTVIFSPEAFLSLIGAFSNLFNAQSILDKQSLSTPDSLGSQLASPLLSLWDDACHPDHVGATLFDGEGTPTRRTSLIEKGILTGFLHSAGTAKRMQSQPTGHANMGAKITVSPHFYHVLPGERVDANFDLATAENVIFVDDLQALHAGVKALQGSFSLPFEGWRVHRGEWTSIESATVAGDFLQVLRSLVFVEPQAHVTPGGICPRIWVEGLAITGE